ncbi:hypothetical protein L798_05835 [Zootermopsis nevadensis]|uniref:Uncharacterized protein n=1 Tax=Zootermopsis nevadensis TaxID=136037 RepID=A0A067RI64_ZOONE|nr:hypothetical protein L798_05835 [Zootermopsis nevadensis]
MYSSVLCLLRGEKTDMGKVWQRKPQQCFVMRNHFYAHTIFQKLLHVSNPSTTPTPSLSCSSTGFTSSFNSELTAEIQQTDSKRHVTCQQLIPVIITGTPKSDKL